MFLFSLILVTLFPARIHRTFDSFTTSSSRFTNNDSNELEYKWFDQKLDHFSATTTTFKQRYLEDDQFYWDSHVLFVYISGEGTMSNKVFDNLVIPSLAKEYGAYMVALEHRYYGESQPFQDWEPEHLQYLTSKQALADLAEFITAVQNNHTDLNLNKVVIFGGSYAGCLSAWFRQMYPHIVIGSISSSGPVQAQEEFFEYDQAVSEALDDQCRANLKQAVDEIENELDNNFDALKEMFGCKNLDQVHLASAFSDSISGAVQYNDDNGPEEKQTIHKLCKIMTTQPAEGKSYKDQFYEWFNYTLQSENATCDEYGSDDDIFNTTYDPQRNGRQWTYQTCNEFGYFQTAPKEDSLRSPRINLDWYEGICQKAFGIEHPDRRIDETNKFYHKRDAYATNVVFSVGTRDPWTKLAIGPKYLDNDGRTDRQHWKVQEIINGSHCTDLHAPKSSDPDSLVQARETIKNAIGQWIDYATVKKTLTTNDGLFISGVAVFCVTFVFCVVGLIICIFITVISKRGNKVDYSKY